MVLKFNKIKFKSDLQNSLFFSDPEFCNKIRSKDWDKVIIFIQGFESCLRLFGEEPLPDKEVIVFLNKEAISFLYKNFDN